LSFVHAPAVGAQEVEDEAQLDENVIVVTAQKRAQDVQEVPLAISVSTGEDLERLQVQNVDNLQYSTPSLVVAGSDPTRKSFGIRGISDRSRNAGFDNRIGVYVDGVWVGRSAASNQGVLDVASIEILRGPQGTLFGKNTVAGAINIISERPESGYFGHLEGDLGNFDLRRVKGMVNLGFSDSAAARVSGVYTKRDGFTQNVSNGLDYDNRDEYSLRGQFQFETGATTIYLAGDTSSYDFRATAGGERVGDPLAPADRVIAIDQQQDVTIEYSGVSAQIDHEFGNGGTLTSISAYRNSDSFASGDEDYTPLNLAATSRAEEETSHFSQEVRYASPSDDDFDYVVGLYYLDQDIDGGASAYVFARAINPAAPPVFVNVDQDSTVTAQTFAAFLHANYRFTEQLQLTFGARLTREKKNIDYRIADTSRLFTNGTLTDSRAETDFSPTVSLNYFATDDVMIYGRYARGFKSGGWNADFVPSIADIAFEDETVDAFELGAKTFLFDRRLRLNMAAYLSKHSDFQVFSFRQLSNGGTALSATNAGKLTSKGIEIEADLTATDWLNLYVNYGYNDASFDRFANGGGPGVDFDGNRPSEAPKHNLSLGVATDFDLGFATLVAQADYNYRSSFFSNPNNIPVNLNGALETVNLRAGIKFGKVSVFAWMRNAFDRTEQIFNSRSFLGIPRAQFNDPQTYGVTVRVEFGN
jgi:iron complex outermembrane receptor protein